MARLPAGVASATTDAGIDVLMYPMTDRLTVPGLSCATLPYAGTTGAIDLDRLERDRDARDQLSEQIVEVHPDGATALTAPHFYVHHQRSAGLGLARSSSSSLPGTVGPYAPWSCWQPGVASWPFSDGSRWTCGFRTTTKGSRLVAHPVPADSNNPSRDHVSTVIMSPWASRIVWLKASPARAKPRCAMNCSGAVTMRSTVTASWLTRAIPKPVNRRMAPDTTTTFGT